MNNHAAGGSTSNGGSGVDGDGGGGGGAARRNTKMPKCERARSLSLFALLCLLLVSSSLSARSGCDEQSCC